MIQSMKAAEELCVGTEGYYRFRTWLSDRHHFSTRRRLITLKPEYLMQYFEEYKRIEQTHLKTLNHEQTR